MNRSTLYAIIAVLVLVAVGLAFWLAQERQSESVEIKIGGSGISIEKD